MLSTLFKIARYALGSFIIIGALALFSTSALVGVLLLLAGLTLCPIVWEKIGDYIDYPKFIPVILPIILFVLAVIVSPTPSTNNEISSESSTETIIESISSESTEILSETTEIITEEIPEPNTSDMVDYIQEKAKSFALSATEDQINKSIEYIKSNIDTCTDSSKSMEDMIYHSRIVEYYYLHVDKNEELADLGFKASKVVKYLYRGIEDQEASELNRAKVKEYFGLN